MRKNEFGIYEVDVDGRRYEFEKWGAEESLDVLLDISSIIGGPLGAAIGQMFSGEKDKSVLEKEVNADMMTVAFESLAKNLKKDVVKPIFKKLCADKVLCEGKKINFNTHYQEDLMHMFRVAKAGLEVQYGNFLDAAQGLVGPKRPQAVINRA